MTNREFAEKSASFKDACQQANVLPTKRQASKYRLGKGRAKKGNKNA